MVILLTNKIIGHFLVTHFLDLDTNLKVETKLNNKNKENWQNSRKTLGETVENFKSETEYCDSPRCVDN